MKGIRILVGAAEQVFIRIGLGREGVLNQQQDREWTKESLLTYLRRGERRFGNTFRDLRYRTHKESPLDCQKRRIS